MASVIEEQLPQVKWVGVMHEGVPCRRSDLDACIKFYQDVLGLKLLPRPAIWRDAAPGWACPRSCSM